jgi:hypothetical protein
MIISYVKFGEIFLISCIDVFWESYLIIFYVKFSLEIFLIISYVKLSWEIFLIISTMDISPTFSSFCLCGCPTSSFLVVQLFRPYSLVPYSICNLLYTVYASHEERSSLARYGLRKSASASCMWTKEYRI